MRQIARTLASLFHGAYAPGLTLFTRYAGYLNHCNPRTFCLTLAPIS